MLLLGVLSLQCGSWNNRDRGGSGSGQGGDPQCGDEACSPGESCSSCPSDCGACPGGARCGDEQCGGEETCSNCPGDCGACASACGDARCTAAESCASCPGDCGPCAAACPASGTSGIRIRDIAIRDDELGRYYLGVKASLSTLGPLTMSGLRLVDGTVLRDFVVQDIPRGPEDEWVALPGRPDCPLLAQPETGRNCRCDFVMTFQNGTDQCSVASVTNCSLCGVSNPNDHGTTVQCTSTP